MIWRFWKRADQTTVLLRACKSADSERGRLLTSIATRRRELEQQLWQLNLAEAALLVGVALQQQPELVGDSPWFAEREEFESAPKTQAPEPTPTVPNTQEETLPFDSPKGNPVIADAPVATPPQDEVLPFAQHFPANGQENGEEDDARRRAFIRAYLETQAAAGAVAGDNG